MNIKQMEILADFTKKHRRTLAKIHKIKLENKVLSSRIKSIIKRNNNDFGIIEGVGFVLLDKQRYSTKDIQHLLFLSERIGANGNRIQRLRTKLSQMKKEFNTHTT